MKNFIKLFKLFKHSRPMWMAIPFVTLMLLNTASCNIDQPLLTTASEPTTPSSLLDGTPMYPNSWHKAHVCFNQDTDAAKLDDGSFVVLFLTGGTHPYGNALLGCGMIYVSVPSYESNDQDNTYYFQKFVPDGEQTGYHKYTIR
jgi:hypothetical protein